MALFLWNDTYSVGIKEIDNQHKMLVDSLNELFQAMLDKEAKTIIGGIVQGLADYVGVHFSYEEKLMKDNAYPHFLQHKKQHQEFVTKIAEFQEKFKQGKLMLSMEVMNFLKDWLKSHILGEDKKYSPYLLKKGVE